MPEIEAQPVRRIVRIRLKSGHAAEACAALVELARATREEPQCREFRFYQALDDDHSVILVEDFASPAALETHMQQPHTRAFFLRGLTEQIAAVPRDWMS